MVDADVDLAAIKEGHAPDDSARTLAAAQIDEGGGSGDEGVRVVNRELHRVGGIVGAHARVDHGH